MDSGNLTAEQLQKIQQELTRYLRYLRALGQRMQQRQFPHDDELRCHVARVVDATDSLCNSLHYMVCNRIAKRNESARGQPVRAYRVQCVVDPGAPAVKTELMDLVEAETPLEAVAKLARHARLPTAELFYVRIVLVEQKGRAERMVVIPLSRKQFGRTVPMAMIDSSSLGD